MFLTVAAVGFETETLPVGASEGAIPEVVLVPGR